MNPVSNAMLIDITLCKHHVPESGTTEERMRATMKAVKEKRAGLMYCRDEDEQFRVAVGAVMLCVDDDERERIADSMKPLRFLSALMSGIPVDIERMAAEIKDKGVLFPLSLWWREA